MMALNAPADPASGERATGSSPRRWLDSLWIAASSPQLTIALAVLLAFACAITALLPQLPAGLDPIAASRWLSTAVARLGRFGSSFSSIGLFELFSGPWIIVLLTLMILVGATWMGLYLARRITRPVQMLAVAADENVACRVDHRVAAETRDVSAAPFEALN